MKRYSVLIIRENANQNHSDLWLYTHYDVCNYKDRQEHAAKIFRNENSDTLMGKWKATATFEDNLAIQYLNREIKLFYIHAYSFM